MDKVTGQCPQTSVYVFVTIRCCACFCFLLLLLFGGGGGGGGGSSGTGRGVEVVIATRHTVECVCERCRQGQVRARHQASSTAVEYQRSAIVVWLL